MRGALAAHAARRPRRARIVTAGGAPMTADRIPRDAELAEELEGPATDLAADVEPGRTSAIAALRYRDFRLFWFGLLVSNVGTWMQMFGQGYLVVLLAVRDGVPQLAPLYLGLVGLARAIPGLTLGAGLLFYINAISYLAVVVALLRMRPVPVVGTSGAVTMLESIREGLAYIRQDVVVKWIVILAATTALFARPYIQLLPAVAHDLLKVGAVELSWMLAASGVGALGGALATSALGGLRRRGVVLIGSAVAFGVFLVAFTLQRSLLVSLPFLVLLGFSTMVFLGMANGLLQTRAPDHLRGRVMSVYTMVFMGLMPLGSMVMGSIGSVAGTASGLFAGGVACTLVALFAVARIAPLREATGGPARLAARRSPSA